MKSKHDRPIDNCRTLINCQPVADRIYEEEKLFCVNILQPYDR